MVDADIIEKALEMHRALWVDYDDLRYIRFVDDFRGIARGTAIFDDIAVFGFPSIGRVLSLHSGLSAQFSKPFWIEEKVDGFNVRIAKVHNRVIALTRGGFICPFTTDRIDDLMDTTVFNSKPGIIVCGEVAGPDNPYMDGSAPYLQEDVQLFTFDIRFVNETNFIAYPDKERIIQEFNLPSVTRFGRFQLSDKQAIHDILMQLNDEYREGIIFKEDSARDHRAKYTTSNINIIDVQSGAYTMFDLPPEYFKNRIARLVLFMQEQGVGNTVDMQRQLGAAYIDGLFEAIQQVQEHHKVFRTFRCRFRQRENAVKLLKRLNEIGGHVQITLRELKEEGGYWLLEFEKVFAKSSGTLSSLLKGQLMFD